MNTRTSTLLIASALAAIAFNSSAQAADKDANAQQGQGAAHAATQKAPVAKPVRSLPGGWWEEERARDDGYAWPLDAHR